MSLMEYQYRDYAAKSIVAAPEEAREILWQLSDALDEFYPERNSIDIKAFREDGRLLAGVSCGGTGRYLNGEHQMHLSVILGWTTSCWEVQIGRVACVVPAGLSSKMVSLASVAIDLWKPLLRRLFSKMESIT